MSEVEIPVEPNVDVSGEAGGGAGGEPVVLEGRLEGTEGGPAVVVCHPHPAFGGTLHTAVVAALAAQLADAGMHVLRFNFRGVGASGGVPRGGVVEHFDVRAACAFLRARGAGEVAIAGYSFGALMAARAIAAGEHARAFVALGFPTTIIGDDPERLRDVEAAVRAQPTLFVSGDRDQFCELARVTSWVEMAPAARMETVPGAGHFPTGAALDDLIRHAIAFLHP